MKSVFSKDRTNRLPGLCAAAALALTLFAGGQRHASATTMVPTNIAMLSEIAESVFVVKIESVETLTSGSRAYDKIRGIVTEPVAGDRNTSDTVEWNQFRIARNMPVPAMPTYEAGKEYLIFLTGKGPGTGYQSPVGLGQGAFAVTRHPQTGAIMVRNAYNNSTLTSGLNVDRAANDMVDENPQTRSLRGTARTTEVNKARLQMQARGGNNFEGLKDAVQFFHQKAKRGQSPARDYFTSTPVQLIR